MLPNYFRRLALFTTLLGLVSINGCTETPVEPPDSSTCGDRKVDSGEQCDDGNKVSGDGCDATCRNEDAALCGNGAVDAGEECDDGNKVDGDGCTACKKDASTSCGDGKVDAGEQCDDGNKVNGDGCETTCVKTSVVEEVVCGTLAPLPQGTCEVAAGDAGKLIIGTVLTPDTIYRGGQVLVDAEGIIVNVGCDCAKAPDMAACTSAAASATRITCPTGVISAALINSHDHITFTQNDPYNDTGERYEHRHDWRSGKNGHTKITTPGSATADEVLWGELRFLMGGAASTVGSGSTSGLLRNLDRDNHQEGLNQTPVDFQTFPLGDSNSVQLASGCGYPKIITESSIMNEDAFFPHVAEGINAFAENEFICMSSSMNGGQDLVQPQSAFIHSVGLKAPEYAAMAQDGTALIWSPRSNITLYGDTAVVTEAARLGVLIALGTDWIATGSMNLIRELRCADDLNKSYLGGYFTDQQLWQMVTVNAATATATDDVIGALAPGKIADISIFDGKVHKDFRAVIDAEPQDVTLVMRAGKVLYGDGSAVAGIGGSGACDAIDVCGAAKQLCLQGEVGKNFAALKASVGGIYPAFFCGGPPMNEPSCTPMRPTSVMGSSVYDGTISAQDPDGDGLLMPMDNCPSVFNPIRPLDSGKQADFDADGVGDACDVCPLDANTTVCKVFDPKDTDGDGTPNTTDNCPDLANPGQADADMDGKGDECDLCPNQANPGNTACLTTIYAIKNGTVPVGSTVAIANALVTARYASGFFLQVKPGDAGYMGSDYSGIFVYAPANVVLVGDRVSISSALSADYFGQIQLTGAVTKVDVSAGELPPDPVKVTSAQIATGGAKAAALESVIVEVSNPTVTDTNPTPGTADMAPTHEFVIDDGSGGVRVNDLLFLTAPPPTMGDTFTSVSGILDRRNDNSKIELRSAADLKGGLAKIVAFGPALSFADAGQVGGATYPTALTVTLASAPMMDTFVAITSSDPTSLTVVGGGVTILAGTTTAQVLVDGLLQSAKVTLTAALNVSMFMADVRVLGAAEMPVLASLTPATAAVPPGGTKTFTVTLDIPAPVGGTSVALALTPPNAGAIPATVTVLAGQLSATFDYVDASMAQSASVMATLGAQSKTSTLTIAALAQGLIINEVDYDQSGTDNNEFVEIYNGTGAPISLTGFSLVLVNGANNTAYKTIDLGPAGMLADKQYLVLASNTVVVPGTALKIAFSAAADNVQNGQPDGLAIVDTVAKKLVDALSYEGGMTAVTITGLGVVSLVEGTQLPAAVADSNTATGSLCRLPNGSDTNDAKTDWAFSATPTPGAANVP